MAFAVDVNDIADLTLAAVVSAGGVDDFTVEIQRGGRAAVKIVGGGTAEVLHDFGNFKKRHAVAVVQSAFRHEDDIVKRFDHADGGTGIALSGLPDLASFGDHDLAFFNQARTE